jgi:hypothetical protein
MREKYIEMRNDRVLDVDFLYSYLLSKGGTLQVNEFMYGLQFLDTDFLLKKLDAEFQLTILVDLNGNFIKVIN